MFKFIHLCSEGQALICVKLTIKREMRKLHFQVCMWWFKSKSLCKYQWSF